VCDWYEVHGYRFGLRSSSEAFAGWLRYALGAYLTAPTAEEEDDYPTYSVVVEDGTRGEERVGRRYNILYLGTRDIARTLDLRFLARCLVRQIDSIGYHARNDAVFLEAGLLDVAGSPRLIHSYVVPALCAARRRAEKRGIHAPGGMVAALDLHTGELIAPRLSLDVPADAFDRLEEHIPGGLDGVRDRFPIEDGERRSVGTVMGFATGQQEFVGAMSRPETVLYLVAKVKNMDAVGGQALRSIAAMVRAADCRAVMWSSTNEMIDAIALAAEDSNRGGTNPAVAEIRPKEDA
jgi:hypothetical protein